MLGLPRVAGLPRTAMRPLTGPTRPRMARIRVVLPAPFGPSTPMNSPSAIARLISASTVVPAMAMVAWSTTIAAPAGAAAALARARGTAAPGVRPRSPVVAFDDVMGGSRQRYKVTFRRLHSFDASGGVRLTEAVKSAKASRHDGDASRDHLRDYHYRLAPHAGRGRPRFTHHKAKTTAGRRA